MTLTAQNITVQVTTAQPWIDSGLDLQSGDVVEISAAVFVWSGRIGCASLRSQGRDFSGIYVRKPALPTAPVGALIARLHAQGAVLQKANKAKTLTYYLPSNPVQDARNATGDGYHSDGRLLVIFLQ